MGPNRSEPLVGIVVPAFDVEPWLGAMLESLRAQRFPNWQAVVVDDWSADGTLAVARTHAQADARITVVSNPKRGPGARLARIHGRSLLAKDVDYLYFPDADDVLERELVGRVVERLEARPDAVAAFCRHSTIDEHGEPADGPSNPRHAPGRRWARCLDDWEEDTPFASLYAGAPAWEGMTMFRRAAYDETGGFEHSPAWVSHTTLDLLLRLSMRGPVVFVPDCLYRRRLRPGQMSLRHRQLEANEAALRRRWSRRAAVDPEVRPFVTQADFLWRHRLTPRRRLSNAAALARRGNVVAAAPRVVLAAAAYRWRAPAGSS